MCSLTLALTGLTTGLQMAGQYQQSRAQAAAYNAQAQAAQAQAEASYQNARIQNRKGEQLAEQYAQQQRQLDAKRRLAIGQQIAAAGSSGIAAGIGSSLDIMGATNDAWQEDSINLLSNQRNAQYDNYVQEVNLRNQGNAYEAQATNYRAQASAAKTAGTWGMVGTLLSGAASMYGMKGAGSSTNSGPYFASPSTGFLSGSSAISATQASMSGVLGNTLKVGSKMPGWTKSFNYYGG